MILSSELEHQENIEHITSTGICKACIWSVVSQC